MLKDITIGQYIPGDTKVHNLDPRVKIMITFVFIASLFFINKYFTYIFVIAFMALALAISKIELKYMFKGLKPLIAIILLTVALNIFMTEGEVIYTIWKLKVTREGLSQAGFMALRLIFLITGASLLTLTTSPISLTDGIEKLLSPFRKIGVPAHEIAMMMTIALRFIPTLLEETDKIMKAQMARGADFESGNIIKRAKAMIPLLVPLFISAFRRADELALAMEARCYRGGENRTRMKQLKLELVDLGASLITVVFFGAILWSRYFVK
ncbi:MAG: energy-coupling factor transporter transmembrane protein EcfT [Clostridiales bacterium]|nr:energy-coupling factor transporter transmembrane protein EcfT [Clostridiales bacterium]